MANAIMLWIGQAICVACGLMVVAGAIIGLAMLSNRAAHAWLDSYGGWKVFMEFREWYFTKRPTEQKENP